MTPSPEKTSVSARKIPICHATTCARMVPVLVRTWEDDIASLCGWNRPDIPLPTRRELAPLDQEN